MTELRNDPIQARSNSRLQTIRLAALQHLADVGRDRFSTAGVVKLAGCSIGTFYRYFDDRVAILDDIWPDRDSVLEDVVEILEAPLPVVTSSRERDRKNIMNEALGRIRESRPTIPVKQEAAFSVEEQ